MPEPQVGLREALQEARGFANVTKGYVVLTRARVDQVMDELDRLYALEEQVAGLSVPGVEQAIEQIEGLVQEHQDLFGNPEAGKIKLAVAAEHLEKWIEGMGLIKDLPPAGGEKEIPY